MKPVNDTPTIHWQETDAAQSKHSARWRSEAGLLPPQRVQIADDRMTAEAAHRLTSEGTCLLWRGDYHNARQLLQALTRRIERKAKKTSADPKEAFHLHRQAQGQRARLLAMLLIPLDADYRIPLRRAPEVQQACQEAYGAIGEDSVVSLRELQALVGAHEWRKKGVEIATLGARIHPYYGVFSPLRGEYLDLLAAAPLPKPLHSNSLAFDIGTGTGVIAALLAKRGITKIIATDHDARALACARDNLARLGFERQVEVMEADLFPPGRAPLIVCNPPWVPARPSSPIEYAIFDPESRMLKGFLTGLGAHLSPGGEGWLILSDLAEHLGLRSRDELLGWIAAAGLQVTARHDIRPRRPKASDANDPLHAARAAEITSLWRLSAQ